MANFPVTSIAVCVPTLGRPLRLRALLDSILQTTSGIIDLAVYVGVDTHEKALYDLENYKTRLGICTLFFEPGTPAPRKWDMLGYAARGYDVIVAAGDDCRFTTPKWDTELIGLFNKQNDPYWLLYLNDGRNREKCEHWVMTTALRKVLGFFCPTKYQHFCCDQHLADIASHVDRLYWAKQIILLHEHKKYGLSQDDDTYRKVREESIDSLGKTTTQRDNELYVQLYSARRAAANRWRQAVKEYRNAQRT